jgi:hypothetical protein
VHKLHSERLNPPAQRQKWRPFSEDSKRKKALPKIQINLITPKLQKALIFMAEGKPIKSAPFCAYKQ